LRPVRTLILTLTLTLTQRYWIGALFEDDTTCYGTVLVSERDFALEDAVGSHILYWPVEVQYIYIYILVVDSTIIRSKYIYIYIYVLAIEMHASRFFMSR
jgi:hypothetical protein